MSRISARRSLRCVAALLALLPLGAAHASIEILIPDVTDQIQSNVRAFLSLTRYAERDDITPETMSRLQRRIVAETQDALEPLGYYEPKVKYETAHEGNKWRVMIFVTPGRPVRLSDVSVAATGPGADVRDIREIIEAQELKPGLRLNHGTYERVKGTLLRAAKNEGYLDARLTKNELMIDRTERRATVAIEMDTGKRYSFGEIKIAQDVINDDSMRRLLRMQQGDPYTLDALLRTQYTLDDSQYFSNVSIESGKADREALTVPVTVSAQPNRKHRFATSLGYGTDTEARGKFTWDNRRVNRDGHRFKVELLGSAVIKEISARYVIPVMDVALEKVEFTGDLVEEEIGDTVSRRNEVGTGLTQAMGRWQRVLFVRLSNETTTEGDGTRNTAFYVFPGISYATLPSYITGGRPRPYRLYFELRGSPTTLGSDASFVQFRFQGERKFNFWQRWHLDLRSELGVTRIESNRPQDEQILDLPASQRCFAGGDRSVRGFNLNELSPRDENGDSIGGKHLATGTVEVTRDLPRNFGVAAFYDIGNAFNDFKAPDFEYSVGLGMRYNIAVASFGIDVAQPLSERGRDPKFHLYISTQF
jgi:translocation and assembly module TamA